MLGPRLLWTISLSRERTPAYSGANAMMKTICITLYEMVWVIPTLDKLNE